MKSSDEIFTGKGYPSAKAGDYASFNKPEIIAIQLDALLHAAALLEPFKLQGDWKDIDVLQAVIKAESERLRGGKQEGCQPGK